MIEPLLLAVTKVDTFCGDLHLTNATGFFFEREGRLYLVTNRHVALDEASGHRPERLEIELHTDPDDVARITRFSVPLYAADTPVWRTLSDAAGLVDIVAVPLDPSALPARLFLHAFTPAHLVAPDDRIEVGTSVLIVGFPLGFHDDLHHLPVARQAVIASAFGIRFQGQGYFLTDARTHRGASGAPVVARAAVDSRARAPLSWILLGVHAARLDVTRDLEQDSRLNLNCAWYAEVLLDLTAEPVAPDGDPSRPQDTAAQRTPAPGPRRPAE